jgi:hypothetical protein
MNSKQPHEHRTAANTPSPASADANPDPQQVAVPVPVFNCLVYVLRDPSAGVRARVVNLAGLECTAATEREALGKLVPAFKQRISELIQNQQLIPWIDPPPPLDSGEQQRFIAVHL